MYKIGLKLWSINTDYYYDEAIRLYNNGVFDYIELYVVPDTLDTLQKWKKLRTLAPCGRGQGAREQETPHPNLLPQGAREHGIPFIIHCPHFAHGFNLAKKEKKESNKKIFKQVQRFADELNAEYIIVHGGIDGNIEETAKQFAALNDSRALIENKPYIALPNRMGGNFCRGYNTEEIKKVIDTANCGFCLDFGHAICAANSLKQEIYSYVEEFIKLKPNMFHLTDIDDITSEYDSHPHIGTGQLDVKRILNLIPEGKNITIETIKNSKENLNDFIEDYKNIKTL